MHNSLSQSIPCIESQSTILTGMHPDYFYEIQIILPDDIITYQFYKAGLALFEKIDLNIKQIQTLTKIRDSLLPKLMSGQIRVKE